MQLLKHCSINRLYLFKDYKIENCFKKNNHIQSIWAFSVMLMVLMMMMSRLLKNPLNPDWYQNKGCRGKKKEQRENLALTTEAGSMWSPVCWLVGFEATGFCQEAYCDSWPVSLLASQRKPDQFSWSSSHACREGGCACSKRPHCFCSCDTVNIHKSFLLTHALWVSFCFIWNVFQKSRDN